jgi:shikimate dehydrogenase
MVMTRKFGLIGEKLSHSFSKGYFDAKFLKLSLSNYVYSNYEFSDLSRVNNLLNDPEVVGLNVTNPYKTQIIPYLSELSNEAKEINAVNCIKIANGKSIGFNTDCYGFSQSIKPFLEPIHNKALIIGTGGSSKAVAYALQKIGVDVFYLSRTQQANPKVITYDSLNANVINACKLIVNCTPIGLFPDLNESPQIPYEFITPEHLCYDLIYNPPETQFLLKCNAQGALIVNGLSMLHQQAEKAWEIWQE